LEKDKQAESKILKERGENYLNPVKNKIEAQGIPVEVILEEGQASEDICKYADYAEIDLIVMTTQGMGAAKSWAVGSVSDKVIRHSLKPVLCLRARRVDLLKGKTILIVDDQPDVLEALEELLDMCVIHKATNAESALQFLRKNKYDIAILDIMGVNGLELLKHTVKRGIPTVMLTAHALTAETSKESIRSGAVFYMPKEKMTDIENVLSCVMESGGRPVWKRLLGQFLPYFMKRFKWGAKDKENFLNELGLQRQKKVEKV